MTPIAYFIETSYDPDDGHQLRVFDADEISGWLARNGEQLHYTGDCEQVHGIWRNDGDGEFTRLTLKPGRYPKPDGNDYPGFERELRDGDGRTVLAFTIRIDGRA